MDQLGRFLEKPVPRALGRVFLYIAMNKLPRTLLRIGLCFTLVAAVAFLALVFAFGNAVREDGLRVLCDTLRHNRDFGPRPPYLAYKTETLNRGQKFVWTFRKELAQDEGALAEMKAQAQRCNFEFAIQPNPPVSTPYPDSNASPRVLP